MSDITRWIGVEANKGGVDEPELVQRGGRFSSEIMAELPAHQFPGRGAIDQDEAGEEPGAAEQADSEESFDSLDREYWITSTSLWQEQHERTVYRRRTIRMLQRYMRYAHDTGRLPSILGREFFRAKVSAQSMVTFEDRMIFVHDMETCLGKLDEFSRQLIARHILQEHDQEATAKLLGCGSRTVSRYVPIALDLLAEILLDVGLLERTFPIREKYCQGGKIGEISVSHSEESKNIF